MSYRLLDFFSMSYRPHIEASCKVLKKTVEVFDVPILRDVVTEYIIYGFNKCEEVMIHTQLSNLHFFVRFSPFSLSPSFLSIFPFSIPPFLLTLLPFPLSSSSAGVPRWNRHGLLSSDKTQHRMGDTSEIR